METTKAHWHTGDNKVTSVPTYYVSSSEQLCFENTLTTLVTLKNVYMVHFTVADSVKLCTAIGSGKQLMTLVDSASV